MSWQKICALSDLRTGQIAEFDVGNLRVAVVRGDDGVLVIPPMCPHLEEPLRDGFCDGRTLTCHKHLWQWDMKTGSPLGEARKPLLCYATKVEGGDVLALVQRELVYDYE